MKVSVALCFVMLLAVCVAENGPPSWPLTEGYVISVPRNGDTCQQWVTRMLNAKYRGGNWSTGSTSEYNSLVKACSRNLYPLKNYT